MKHSNIMRPLQPKAEWVELFDGMYRDTYTFRKQLVGETAWCILTKEVADILGTFLSRFDSVVEVFAGTGFISEHLRRTSGLSRKQYRSYDACVSHWKEDQRRNYGFTKANCFNVNLKSADVVVMSWPNYDSKIAYKIARKMIKGQYLIYQGEGYGGCTGDDQFHEYLADNFRNMGGLEEKLERQHVQHFGIRDDWYILIKE